MTSKKIKLVLSACGTLYPTYVGAIIRLTEAGFEVEAVCGTSTSSIVAVGLGTGYKPNSELVKYIKQTLPVKHNILKFSWFNLFKKWGLLKSQPLINLISKFTAVSFGEMRIPTFIACSNLTDKEVLVFNSKDHPDLSVGEVVKASMSIPLIMEPSKINGKVLIDGGFSSSFPLDIFGTGEDTIGLKAISKKSSSGKIKSFFNFVFAIFETTMGALAKEHMEDAIFARTLIIKSNFSNLNFNIDESQVEEMIREGYSAVDTWLLRIANEKVQTGS